MNPQLANILTHIPQIVREIETLIPGQGNGRSKKHAAASLAGVALRLAGNLGGLDLPTAEKAVDAAIESAVKEMNADGEKGVSVTQELTIPEKLDAIRRDTKLLIDALVHTEKADVPEPHEVVPDLPPKGVPLTVRAATEWAARYANLTVALEVSHTTGELMHRFRQTGPSVMPDSFASYWYPLA